MNHQFGIIDDIPQSARYQFFCLKAETDPKAVLFELAEIAVENDIVVGFGQSILQKLNASIPNMRRMPDFSTDEMVIPTHQHDLWCWIRGKDRGDLLLKARKIRTLVSPAFELKQVTDGFKFDATRDLTGYEDGTENPKGEDALQAALMQSEQSGLNGSSFVAVQQWLHDLDIFQDMSKQEQNYIIGRDQESNEELDDAPESAHVKRTEQESFDPEAFVVRRSMPWANETEEGFMFVAFGKSFDAFEAQMNRMVGADDGIIDGLFSFTKPITGSYFWCPPVTNGKLDLSSVL